MSFIVEHHIKNGRKQRVMHAQTHLASQIIVSEDKQDRQPGHDMFQFFSFPPPSRDAVDIVIWARKEVTDMVNLTSTKMEG